MWRIRTGLYLGDRYDARDRELLLDNRVTHVLNCAREIPCWFRSDFRYLHLRMVDPDADFQEHIPGIVRFIRRGRQAGGVLVHCWLGVSRSVSATLAYLMHRGMPLDDALELVRRRVGEDRGGFLEPHASFLEMLEDYFEDRTR